jgi:hypothetical protein
MDTHEIDPTAAVDAFAMAVMTSCAQLSLVLSHMHRFAAANGSDAADDSVPETLRKVLNDVLAPLAEEHAIEDLATAVQMLGAATDRIGEDLFVVDVSRLEQD